MEEITEIPKDTIAYIDETGLDYCRFKADLENFGFHVIQRGDERNIV